jgi:6-phosphofructokinase 1
MDWEKIDTTIPTIGPAKIPSPLKRRELLRNMKIFIADNQRISIEVDPDVIANYVQNNLPIPSFEMAGPREMVYFDPSKVRSAIVTCGGLCPGLNDIIRSIVLELHYGYGAHRIYGIRYGLQGFIAKYGHEIMELTPNAVVNIHEMGGTILGSSRGPQPIDEIVDCLDRMNIGILFIVGGDGSLRAAQQISDVVQERGLKTSVISIPKTIDNDIYLVSQSFGFETAVSEATRAIRAAHNESASYPNGIGLIKLMGRDSGFIAATTALAQQDTNFVLIPEVDFDLDGPCGLFAALEERLHLRGHAVIVAAEGAGQRFFSKEEEARDESGNIRLKDIGMFLKKEIGDYFAQRKMDITLKYIDPSYLIRSLPANSNDNVFCSFLGRNAVHAAMAGKTKLLVGRWNEFFVHVPMAASAGKRKKVDPHGRLWMSVLDATGQGPLKNS